MRNKGNADKGNYALTPDYVEAKSVATVAYIILGEVCEKKQRKQLRGEERITKMKLQQFYIDDI